MEDAWSLLLIVVESGGWYAPLMFVLFHVFRQFVFIPPAVVCIAGGLLFGAIPGILYSLIGLTGASILFYCLIKQIPETMNKLSKLKKRLVGRFRDLTISQVALLRLVPIIHYQLLSFCLYERKNSFKGFMKASFLTNIPFVIFYTIFGEHIGDFEPLTGILFITMLLMLAYLLREKITFIKWREFFDTKSARL
ncbi:TVP38/TMEM64 family protein [Mesobacillus subterraneus]|uniref:TVP38/TMEM64 family membrane protein n=1 Tax=Mesobacillus subterraneus TaxID=285983 RepID=A0A3R9E782_9BACI|nr:VTT domain-containing protein [Mesobacillus subterraneus]RSD27670.1 TVP38/TMEM64 family protein [Mesobacillus subterraneus]